MSFVDLVYGLPRNFEAMRILRMVWKNNGFLNYYITSTERERRREFRQSSFSVQYLSQSLSSGALISECRRGTEKLSTVE